jgi:hypothetical protein
MKSGFYFLISALFLCCSLMMLNTEVKACNIPVVNTTPASTYLYVVKNADVIVRATALEAVEDKRTGFKGVKFKVQEVLKGEKIPSTITFFGQLTDKDNYNERPVPYNGVRLAESGSCYAQEYKQGAEFLLFLKTDKGRITDPYWKPLAPTNEQLRSENDGWLKWVKNNLK